MIEKPVAKKMRQSFHLPTVAEKREKNQVLGVLNHLRLSGSFLQDQMCGNITQELRRIETGVYATIAEKLLVSHLIRDHEPEEAS